MANLSTDTQSVIRLVSDLSQSLQREFLAFINPLTYGGGSGRGGGGGGGGGLVADPLRFF